MTADKISKQLGEAAGREFVARRLEFNCRPPPVLAHEAALEIVPAADIDSVPFDADEVEALTLSKGLAGARQSEYVLPYPDERADLTAQESALFGQFSLQSIGRRLSGGDTTAGGDPEITRARVIPKGFEQKHTVVSIKEDRSDRFTNNRHTGCETIRSLHQEELSGA